MPPGTWGEKKESRKRRVEMGEGGWPRLRERGDGFTDSHTAALQSLPLKVEMSPEAFCGKQEENSLGQYGSWWGAMLPLLLVGISRAWDIY